MIAFTVGICVAMVIQTKAFSAVAPVTKGAGVAELKKVLFQKFNDTTAHPILACPMTLSEVQKQERYFGVSQQYFVSTKCSMKVEMIRYTMEETC